MTNDEQRRLVTPVCFTIASGLFLALLVYDAAELEAGHVASTRRFTSTRNAIMGAAIRALAEMLGLAGSIAVGAGLFALMALWIALSYRGIRRARTLRS